MNRIHFVEIISNIADFLLSHFTPEEIPRNKFYRHFIVENKYFSLSFAYKCDNIFIVSTT